MNREQVAVTDHAVALDVLELHDFAARQVEHMHAFGERLGFLLGFLVATFLFLLRLHRRLRGLLRLGQAKEASHFFERASSLFDHARNHRFGHAAFG